MNSSQTVEKEASATRIEADDNELLVELIDGRKIAVPLTWYPRLLHGTPEERNTYELIGRGTGIHWPQLDEDLSVNSILKGFPSSESESSLKKWLAGRNKINK
jgi:hypothetical protein